MTRKAYQTLETYKSVCNDLETIFTENGKPARCPAWYEIGDMIWKDFFEDAFEKANKGNGR